MTVHMFRCFITPGKMSIDDLETRINDWVQSNAEWTEDTVDHTLTERNTAIDDTKSNILQKFGDKLDNKVDWYRVGFHSCTHDETNAEPCSWEDTTEWTEKDVAIPAGIPDLTP